jgi:predicted nucleotidyltransferase
VVRQRTADYPTPASELDDLHVIGETFVSYLQCSCYGVVVDFRHPIEAAIPGAQGRVIAALLGTSGELNLRTIARIAGVSIAQASRVLPGLVELGMIERREVPPSSLFRLVPEHVATRALLDLADSRNVVMTEMGRAASKIRPTPVSVITFGSFARADSEPDSDIDVIIVRPTGIDANDDRWTQTIELWRTIVSRVAGNTVEILDVDAGEVAAKLSSGTQLWRDVRRDGQVVFGERLDALADRVNA